MNRSNNRPLRVMTPSPETRAHQFERINIKRYQRRRITKCYRSENDHAKCNEQRHHVAVLSFIMAFVALFFSVIAVHGLSLSSLSSSSEQSIKQQKRHPSKTLSMMMTTISTTTTSTTTTRTAHHQSTLKPASFQEYSDQTNVLIDDCLLATSSRPALPTTTIDSNTTGSSTEQKLNNVGCGSTVLSSFFSLMNNNNNNNKRSGSTGSSFYKQQRIVTTINGDHYSSIGTNNNPQHPATALDMILSDVCEGEETSSSSSLPSKVNGANGGGKKSFDKNEYEMHVGKALDTLRKDYPKILINDPDYSIYDPRLEVVDPSGVRVRGLKTYKNSIRLIHAIIKILYCPAKSGLTMRMCYDQARQNIRIHWNAQIVPREIFGGASVTLHVDGISVYELDRISGNITEHRFERILMNDAPVMPEDGIIAALQRKHAHTVVSPSFIQQSCSQQHHDKNIILPFQQANPFHNRILLQRLIMMTASNDGDKYPPNHRLTDSSLFALEATNDDKQSSVSSSSSSSSSNSYTTAGSGSGSDDSTEYDSNMIRSKYPTLDIVAYQNKNKSRKKFGLKPLSPDEFLEIEAQVQKLASMQQEKLAQEQLALQQQLQLEEQLKKKKKINPANLLKSMFGNVLQDTCESNFDCERPEVCCDFGFQKRCCLGGNLVGAARWDQMQPIRVPADMNNYPPGRNNNGRRSGTGSSNGQQQQQQW